VLTRSLREANCRSLQLNCTAHVSAAIAQKVATNLGRSSADNFVQSATKNTELANGEQIFAIITFALASARAEPNNRHIDLNVAVFPGNIEGDSATPFEQVVDAARECDPKADWNLYARFIFDVDRFRSILPLPIRQPLPGTPFSEIEGVRLHAPLAPENAVGTEFSVGLDLSDDELFATVLTETKLDFTNAAPFDNVLALAVSCAQTAVIPLENKT
jgi:hypothetical protein